VYINQPTSIGLWEEVAEELDLTVARAELHHPSGTASWLKQANIPHSCKQLEQRMEGFQGAQGQERLAIRRLIKAPTRLTTHVNSVPMAVRVGVASRA
jgi:hypothetical protein